jgi:phage/plasmid-like protein (TIGR03299 family)
MSKRKKSPGGTIALHAPPAPPDDTLAHDIRGKEAVFLGWQQTGAGDIFPLYNITKEGHPSYHSTVTQNTLVTMHLHIPRTPSPYREVIPSPWHNLGTELANPATAREAIEAAGLDYAVVKRPLGEVMAPDDPACLADRWAMVRTDTGAVLGVVGDNSPPIQNRDAFTFFDTLIGSDEAIYETAGVIGRGERVWILAKLPGFISVHGNDIVDKYLLLSNSHDGSPAVRVKVTPIRVACNNTLTAALQGAGEFHIRHTPLAEEDVEQALALLGSSHALYERLGVMFNVMARQKISGRQLRNFVKTLVPDNEAGEDNATIRGVRERFLELHESGQGAELSRGTLWGAFNCVTEYTDHQMEGDPATRLESIWFGRGEQLKMKAFQLIERMM